MGMAPGAFFMLAIFIWVVKGVFLKVEETPPARAPAQSAATAS
jgi:hypothetical protein